MSEKQKPEGSTLAAIIGGVMALGMLGGAIYLIYICVQALL